MDSRIIEVAIGLVLVFLIISVLVSAVQEMLAGWMDTRAKNLEAGIRCLFFGTKTPSDTAAQAFISALFKHPLLFNLSPSDTRLSSYLPSENFARAVMETLAQQALGAGHNIRHARDLIEAVNASPARAWLTPLLQEAGEDIEHFRVQLETQYDHQMDRVSGWYKRHVQWCLLGYGLVFAAVLNVDALQLTQRLWADPVARAAVMSQAGHLQASTHTQTTSSASTASAQIIEQEVAKLDIAKLPIGWPAVWWNAHSSVDPYCALWGMAQSLLGWLITALAASLGAPFWFDAVGKLVRLRGAGTALGQTPKTPAKKSAPATKPSDEAAQRNALIAHYAAQHQDDPSYRPVQTEEQWQ